MALAHTISLVLLVLICGKAMGEDVPLYKSETALLDKLFDDYDREVIPRLSSAAPVTATMQFSLAYILDIDEKKGMLTTSLYPTMTWVDERLKWEYNDTHPFNKTAVLPDKIWIPDVEFYNSFSLMISEQSLLFVPHLIIYNNGTVVYIPHKLVHTPCQFNLVDFPSDSTSCQIDMASWMAPDTVMDLQLKQAGSMPSFFQSHMDWKLDNLTARRDVFVYHESGEKYPIISIHVKLTRVSGYYYRLFVAPAAVSMFVIPVIHFLPPSSNEKLTLGGLMLVGVVIMFEMVEEFFPGFSGSVPLILHYYTALLIILFMSLLLSCLSVMIGTGESKSSRVPRFLRICCIDRLGYICCARGRTSRYDYELLHLEKSLRFSAQRQASREDERELTEVTDDEVADEGAANQTTQDKSGDGMTEVLKTLINELQYARYKEQIKAEWLQLAMVLDRTGGLMLLSLSIIITAVITLHFRQ